MFQTLRKNKVVKNAGWIIGGKVSNKLLAFLRRATSAQAITA